jgi:hypothetical protein
MGLERVTIDKTRGDKGLLLHQPKLVGATQEVTLPRVLSEGEQTALGLSAFFTSAHEFLSWALGLRSWVKSLEIKNPENKRRSPFGGLAPIFNF